MGPVEARLRGYQSGGQLLARLVFEPYGDASSDFDLLVQDIATTGAKKHWRRMQCKSPTEAFGILVWRIRKRLGVAMVLANARFILERVQWVGPGSIAAAERRKRARQRFYDPTTGVSSLRHQYRRATRTPSPYSKFGLMPIPEVNL